MLTHQCTDEAAEAAGAVHTRTLHPISDCISFRAMQNAVAEGATSVPRPWEARVCGVATASALLWPVVNAVDFVVVLQRPQD